MILTLLAGAILVMLGLAQLVSMLALRRFARRHCTTDLDEAPTVAPQVAILLSLRGADPHLSSGLRQLLSQTYPDYRLVIVVDHHEDPAWADVASIAENDDRIQVSELKERLPNCGLKCSALIQAVRSLNDDVGIVVFADADVVADQHWLENLVRPLNDPKVGLVTGAQWFEPPDAAMGSWLRSIWNSGATVPTIMLSHPWAGSCAMRRSDLVRSGLLEQWKHSIVDDGPMADAIKKLGLELRFVSEAWMVNREHCSLLFACRYLKRMLTWSRLYESTYLLTVLHAITTAALFLVLWLPALFNWRDKNTCWRASVASL